MGNSHNHLFYLIYVLVAAAAVYLFAQWNAVSNQYLINDDVRQQIYWMQSWIDPELYQDDVISRYARSYVPWGVQAVYALGSLFMNPVQFTKVVAGVLFVATAGFLFGIGLQFRDDLTAVLVVCVSFLFGVFLDRMAGGLSRGFVYPLMAAYLYFLARSHLVWAGMVLLCQSLFNPYAFLICLGTHGLFVAHVHGLPLLSNLFPGKIGSQDADQAQGSNGLAVQTYDKSTEDPGVDRTRPIRSLLSWRVAAAVVPVAAGIVIMALRYVVFASGEFGAIVTRSDMAGAVEYTDAGRYGIVPVPSLAFEIVRPWVPGFASGDWSSAAGWIVFLLVLSVAVWALSRNAQLVDLRGFRVFAYLLGASVTLYILADLLLMRLFLPSRYLEFSLNLFYCVLCGVSIRIAIERLGLRRFAFPFIVTALVVIGAIRLHNVGVYDYSGNVQLYRFLQSTPKSSLLAGHPMIMDDITTFGRRKAFVTYELSHTWYTRFWPLIKKRTFDFFHAYYADDPGLIRKFCRENGIDYLIVRDEDFRKDDLDRRLPYFEPFGGYIRGLVREQKRFSILDTKEFPPVYHHNGVRVIKPN